VKGLELQVGGIAPIRGESTEITSYDNDGFLVGERVSVKRPETLLLDEVSATVGYLGDVSTPNVFKRLDRMDEHNYTQLLVGKRLSARLACSADWTSADHVDTWREAVRVATRESRVIDAVRVELYQRVDEPEGNGFAVSIEKAVSTRLALSGGYASIDPENTTLNADRIQRGNRLFVESRFSLTPEFSVSLFYTRAVDTDFDIPNQTRFDFIVSYNVLRALQRAGAL
jgi:hypothetical protein